MRIVPVWKYITVAIVACLGVYWLYPTYVWYNQPVEFRTTFGQDAELLDEVLALREEQARIRDATDEATLARVEQLEGQIAAIKNRWRGISNGAIQLGLDLQGGSHILLDVRKPAEVESDAWDLAEAREATIEIISNRVDQYGLAEATITKQGDHYILIQIPGVRDFDITTQARLQMCLLKEPGDPNDLETVLRRITSDTGIAVTTYVQRVPQSPGVFQVESEHRALVQRWLMPPLGLDPDEDPTPSDEYERIKRFIPDGYRFLFGRREATRTGDREWYELFLVKEREELSGDMLASAQMTMGMLNEPEVALQFDRDGARIFRRVTANNINRRLAIVMDNTVYSAPVIRERIAGGQARISGSFTFDEAKQLAVVLSSGRLQADVVQVERRFVGPELGRDSIRSGMRALMISGVLVVVFMIAYYAFTGVVADLALAFNIFLLFGALAMFQATLTLPGLAGFALTVGMAVDANVLIYERIREELKARGITPGTAVDKGYSKAFSAIWDGNITTLLVAFMLLGYGTGPIKGFAVTLALGIMISMFTALFCTRIIMDLLSKRPGATMLSVGGWRLFENTNWNFVAGRKKAFISSGVIIGVTWLYLLGSGGPRMGIDFEGGVAATVTFPAGVVESDVRNVLTAAGVTNARIQTMRGEEEGNQKYIRVSQRDTGSEEETFSIEDVIMAAWTDATVHDEQTVGSKVGQELLWRALTLIAFASVVIIIYIAVRFETRYGVAAVVALWHDVMVTIGIFNILNLVGVREINLPVVAGLLTIVGYSLNDTIVVFDRIRENLKKGESRLPELVNFSINQTLSRTVITAVTTLITAGVLFMVGGQALNDFALTLLIGLVVGTYSSVFIASPILVEWHLAKEREEQKRQRS